MRRFSYLREKVLLVFNHDQSRSRFLRCKQTVNQTVIKVVILESLSKRQFVQSEQCPSFSSIEKVLKGNFCTIQLKES
jgi:hypothetical protein